MVKGRVKVKWYNGYTVEAKRLAQAKTRAIMLILIVNIKENPND
jgi:hypothetical protein